MAGPNERYTLRGGKPGYDRLRILARERWPSTRRLFERAGVGAGARCIDLGCGGGEVTLEIARRVGPSGRAVGIDIDPVKLDLARAAATERDIGNVEFRLGSVREWGETSAYDMVYSRFLLHHLSDAGGILGRMWSGVRDGGVLVVEDADHEGWAIDPPNPGFDFFRRSLLAVIRSGGGDPTFGRRLYRSFLEAGVPSPQVEMVAPLVLHEEGKEMPWNTLESISDSLLAAGLATAAEVDSALKSLRSATDDPRTIVCGLRIFQVWARKGAPVAGS